ncbi:hypothetical protein LFZ25_08785 [Salmonella enterica subsp. enterica serovar Macclesfield str. S-1643]|uniref:Uncharacterized protein n=1 Tax=Salmonella enterica subsp. enterica serovar Macclesfield str. S-1643 TaxID=1242107 RepID=A0A2C9NXU6_SALET|nr:hypothetical protein LFZ25_08785 [Salmonella enterica subsp. enterica serovar Macclesfield str. S-1643]EAA5486871.1 hypothetical protein [Salmonella enterica subsp. enterica serovar Kouka]
MAEKINWHHSEKKSIHPQAIDRIIKAYIQAFRHATALGFLATNTLIILNFGIPLRFHPRSDKNLQRKKSYVLIVFSMS